MAFAAPDHRDQGRPTAGPLRAKAQRHQRHRTQGYAAAAGAAAVVPPVRARRAASAAQVGRQDPLHGPHGRRLHPQVDVQGEQLVRGFDGQELPGGVRQTAARNDEIRGVRPQRDAIRLRLEYSARAINTELSVRLLDVSFVS